MHPDTERLLRDHLREQRAESRFYGFFLLLMGGMCLVAFLCGSVLRLVESWLHHHQPPTQVRSSHK